MGALRASARTSSAKAQAASIIGSRALSRRELEKRLVRKGNDQADAQAAADWLEDIGAVDDAAYAAAVVRDYGRRGYGPAKVREELRRRGVPRELWDAAMEELPDSGAVLDALIQKKCRGELSDPREIKRVSDSLLRRGFSWGEVRSALRPVYGAGRRSEAGAYHYENHRALLLFPVIFLSWILSGIALVSCGQRSSVFQC